jgi:hypothetical protein
LVEWLEAQKAGFVIVARLTGPIKRRLAHLLVRTGNRSRLNLPASGHREPAWLHALRTIERLRV